MADAADGETAEEEGLRRLLADDPTLTSLDLSAAKHVGSLGCSSFCVWLPSLGAGKK